MTSTDFLNYALSASALITALGTFTVGILNLRKSAKIEHHTNGLVAQNSERAAKDARVDERQLNLDRGGTTGTETPKGD